MSVPTTLICTTYNEADSIRDVLDSIKRQTTLPKEIVIVDAKSTDGTIEIIERYAKDTELQIRLIVEKGCNIPEGRNIAIENATYDIITIVDGGTELDPKYVEEITSPLLNPSSSADVVGGYYRPHVTNCFQLCTARFSYFPKEAFESGDFHPSVRSMALTKSAWNSVGGFPENLDFADDTVFDLQLKQTKAKFEFAPDALVYWEHDTNWRDFLRRRRSYAYWDGLVNVNQGYYKSAVFSFGLVGLLAVSVLFPLVLLLLLVLLSGVAWRDLDYVSAIVDNIECSIIKLIPMMIAIRASHEFVRTAAFFRGKFERSVQGAPEIQIGY